MKLPTEIRLTTYEHAMDDLVKEITALRPIAGMSRYDTIYTFLTNPHMHPFTYAGAHDGTTQSAKRVRNLKGAPLSGPLALLHTSSAVRRECLGPLLARITRHEEDVVNNWRTIVYILACTVPIATADAEDNDFLRAEAFISRNHMWKLKKVKETLEGVARLVDNAKHAA